MSKTIVTEIDIYLILYVTKGEKIEITSIEATEEAAFIAAFSPFHTIVKCRQIFKKDL